MHFVPTKDRPLQLQLTHVLQEGEIDTTYCCSSISSFSDKTDLYHTAAAERVHIPQKGGNEGTALGSPQLPMAPGPTHGKGHCNSPDLSAMSSPGHAAETAQRKLCHRVKLSQASLGSGCINFGNFLKA